MTPSALVAERPAILLAADTVTLNSGDGNSMVLAKEAFTPGPDLTVDEIVEADFDGYSRRISSAVPTEGVDPLTGDYLVTIPPPAGGWRFETTGVTNLPQTIFGFVVVNQDNDVLYGSQLLDDPVVLTGNNQELLIPVAAFRLLAGGIV